MGDDFSKWVDQAEATRNSLRDYLDRVVSESIAPPNRFTRDEFILAAESQIESLTDTLKNFVRV